MSRFLTLVGTVLFMLPLTAKESLPTFITPRVQDVIQQGLSYLMKVQQPDGRFVAAWEGGEYPAVMTGIAGIALLASGSTPEEGPYAESIRRALLYLLALAESRTDGLIAGGDEYRCTYGHSFAMQFLALCYGMEPGVQLEKRIKRVLDKAIALVARGQSPKGGWLYHPTGGGAEGSTTAAVLQALRACRNAGLKVPRETIDRAVGYLQLTQNPDGGIAYSDVFRGGSRYALSAAGIACYYSAGIYDRATGGEGREAEMVEKLVRYVKTVSRHPHQVQGHYYYHHFYMAQAMYLRGEQDWKEYFPLIVEDLLKKRAVNGTWVDEDVGPTYGTANALIILQIPYAHLPMIER